jgi:hypothetical protein
VESAIVSEFSEASVSPRIRWDGVLDASPLEEAFRKQQADEDMPITRASILVGAVGLAAFVVTDLRFVDPGWPLWAMIAARLAAVILSIVLWFGLKVWPSRIADRWLSAWCLGIGGLMLFIIATRPAGFAGPIILTLLTVVGSYTIIPVPLARQVLSTLPLSICSIVIAWYVNGVGITATATVVGLVLANILGAVPSWRLNRRRRMAFLAELADAQIRARLEQALGEVRTLRGMISICAWCKRVRDKEAVWHQIEMYVQNHTHAEFTHGICPSCVKKQMAEKSCVNMTGPAHADATAGVNRFIAAAAPGRSGSRSTVDSSLHTSTASPYETPGPSLLGPTYLPSP